MDLYQLNHLDNADKHVEITPVLRATRHPPFHLVDANGRIVKTVQGNTLSPSASGVSVVTLMEVQSGLSFELDNDAECAPSIFFSHPNGLIASPAIPTLQRYTESVQRTVAGFEKAIP